MLLNGERLRGSRPLQLGDRIELGTTEIVFELAMNTLQPVSVALKFGFLAVLYLFLLWVARSALRDLRGGSRHPRGLSAAAGAAHAPPDATGLHSASAFGRSDVARRAPRLVVGARQRSRAGDDL